MFALLLTALPVAQQVEAGIPQALARERARRVSGVEHRLAFDLRAGAGEARGRGSLAFTLKDARHPLVVDFDGSDLSGVTVNGRTPSGRELRRVHNHLVLAPSVLRRGRNTLAASFASPLAATGTPVTVYRDPAAGEEFQYTLLVPAEAHRLFPCFDQPDLKARFALELAVPEGWEAVSNAREAGHRTRGGRAEFRFQATEPISTYLFAFAAGPFAVEPSGGSRMLLRRSKTEEAETRRLFALHDDSRAWLEDWFARPYPFPKLDFVLLPGFPYGGMEHPGCIFYRESALVFDHAPTESELFRRSTLIYHEVSHQWFGNLVTMEWFDDLWLKEGFATFMGYSALAALEPGRNAWLRFHQRVKPPAYAVDVTEGTVPVWQELANLADAKSNYGPIVYNKAPAVLRMLEGHVGPEAFRNGVRTFLEEHAWGNARWTDLVAAIESASGQDLRHWSERWILSPGMPRVRARRTSGRLEVSQESTLGDGGLWPLRLDLGGGLEADLTGATTRISAHPGGGAILLNADDRAYGQFLLGPMTSEAAETFLAGLEAPLERAVAFTALWETVREAEIPPVPFAMAATNLMAEETDALTHGRYLGTLRTVEGRYLTGTARRAWKMKLSAILREQLEEQQVPGQELEIFRALARLSADGETLGLCRRVAGGGAVAGEVRPGVRDRALGAAALLAAGRSGAAELLAEIEASEDEGRKWAWIARAAAPDAGTKARYWEQYLQAGEPPEQWIQESLAFFHWPGQEPLTLPYLKQALGRLEWVKANRRIFFLPAWIDAFVNAHSTPEALEVVEGFLEARPDLPVDIRRKVLQSVDSLRRAVRIRARYPSGWDGEPGSEG